MQNEDKPVPAPPVTTVTREPWVKPELSRIAAGDAEFGATPLVPEGAFAFGS